MSIQSQLNNAAFEQLPQVYSAMKNSQGNIKGSMEQVALRELSNCYPCLDNMSDHQKSNMDSDLIERFKFHKWI